MAVWYLWVPRRTTFDEMSFYRDRAAARKAANPHDDPVATRALDLTAAGFGYDAFFNVAHSNDWSVAVTLTTDCIGLMIGLYLFQGSVPPSRQHAPNDWRHAPAGRRLASTVVRDLNFDAAAAEVYATILERRGPRP